MSYPSILTDKIVTEDKIPTVKNTIQGKKLIFTNGCFDLIHPGHLTYLYNARNLGDFLWIGLNSDGSVKRLKGENRPINPEFDRALLLVSLFFVDAVTIFEEDTPIQLLSKIKPDIHVKGGDYKAESLPEYKIVTENGGRIEILPFIDGKSSTNIINKIKKN